MVCFMVEAWERASYYGMRALLTLYTMNVVLATAGEVDSVWGMRLVAPLAGVPGDEVTGLEREKAAQEAASRLYGFYTALVYLTPTLGGFIADNYVGQQRMVLIGGAIMAAGHTLLAYRPAFLVALLLLIIGNGAFKPNLTVMLGRLYVDTGATREESDPDAWAKRNAAFQLFYVGINLGAFVSPLVCGELKAVFGSGPSDPAGYHAGFVAAGVGMLVSLAIFLAGRRYVPPDEIKRPQRLPSRASARRYETIASPQRGRPNAASKASGSGKGGGAWAILTRYRVRTLAYLLACVILVPFWSVFEQGGNTVAVFASEAVALGAIPVEWVQSVNPLFVIALTPVVQGGVLLPPGAWLGALHARKAWLRAAHRGPRAVGDGRRGRHDHPRVRCRPVRLHAAGQYILACPQHHADDARRVADLASRLGIHRRGCSKWAGKPLHGLLDGDQLLRQPRRGPPRRLVQHARPSGILRNAGCYWSGDWARHASNARPAAAGARRTTEVALMHGALYSPSQRHW